MCVCVRVCLNTQTSLHTHTHRVKSCLPLQWAQIGEHDYSQGAKCIRETSPTARPGNAYFPQFRTDTDLHCVAMCFLYDYCEFFFFKSFWCVFLRLSTESPASGRRKVLCSWVQGLLSRCVWRFGGKAEIVLFLTACTSC